MWLYQNKPFTEDDIGNAFGFVYIITNLLSNRKYIGKKFFTKSGRKQVKGKKKKIRVKSDWVNYWGSNKTLQEEVKNAETEHFKREILHLCNTKSECAYLETMEIFKHDAIISDEYYNDWVSCKIRKEHLRSSSYLWKDTNTYNN